MEMRRNRDGDESDKSTKHSDSSSSKSSASDAGRSSHKGLSPWYYSYKQGDASSSNDVGKSKQSIETNSDIKVKHENNDLSQKGDEIVIEHFKPDSGMFRDCRVASVRDFEVLANKLHRALKARKSPECVYQALYFLLREDKAIEKLKNVFQKKDGTNLETALTAHFGEGTPQLKYALELLGKEEANADQTIHQRPGTEEEGKALAKQIHDALLQRDFETVYRALTPFQRNTKSLCQFNGWYKLYKKDTLNVGSQADITGLQADMKQYITGDSLKFGLFLIGDSALETKVTSLSEAERLAKVAREQTFDWDGTRVMVPYEHAEKDCQLRAHIIAEAFKELGYGIEKIVAHYQYTNKYGEICDGLVNYNNPRKKWQYHTACCIQVKTDLGRKERIIDPSCDVKNPNQLWTREEWIKRMGQDPSSCESITAEQWQKEVEERSKQNPKTSDLYPTDRVYIFTTDRNSIGRRIAEAPELQDIPDQYSNSIYEDDKKLMIMREFLPYHMIEYGIYNEMWNKTIRDDQGAQAFLDGLIAKFEKSKKEYGIQGGSSKLFGELFSNAYDFFIKDLKECNVSDKKIECFDNKLRDRYNVLTVDDIPKVHTFH